MSSNNQTSSNAQFHCSNTGVELLSLDGSMNVQPQGTASSLRGEFLMECSDPKCVSGTTPFHLDLSVRIARGSGELPTLLTTVDGKDTPIPVFDSARGVRCTDGCGSSNHEDSPCGGLCVQLSNHRENVMLPEKTKFCVYKVTSAAGELAALSGKLIAVPMSFGLSAN